MLVGDVLLDSKELRNGFLLAVTVLERRTLSNAVRALELCRSLFSSPSSRCLRPRMPESDVSSQVRGLPSKKPWEVLSWSCTR